MVLTQHTIQEKPLNICGNTHKETVLSRGQAESYLVSQAHRQQECPTKMAGTPLLHALPLWELPKAQAQPELLGRFHHPGPSSPVTRAMCPHIYTCSPHRTRGCSARGQQVMYPSSSLQGSGQLLAELRWERRKVKVLHSTHSATHPDCR